MKERLLTDDRAHFPVGQPGVHDVTLDHPHAIRETHELVQPLCSSRSRWSQFDRGDLDAVDMRIISGRAAQSCAEVSHPESRPEHCASRERFVGRKAVVMVLVVRPKFARLHAGKIAALAQEPCEHEIERDRMAAVEVDRLLRLMRPILALIEETTRDHDAASGRPWPDRLGSSPRASKFRPAFVPDAFVVPLVDCAAKLVRLMQAAELPPPMDLLV